MKYFLFLVVLCSINSAQLIGPKISIQQKEFSFGNIKQGDQVSHDYVVVNSGDDTLVIKDVRASCGCTAVKPQKNILLPGESTSISVNFNTKGRRGHQQKHVYITSNDKENPELRLSFTADIEEIQSADSPKLIIDEVNHDFGVISEGKVVDWTVSFRNAGKSLLEIKDVKTSCGCTAAVISGKKINPGESGTIRIEFDSTNRPGKANRTITLLTNDPVQPNQTIIFSADVQKRN